MRPCRILDVERTGETTPEQAGQIKVVERPKQAKKNPRSGLVGLLCVCSYGKLRKGYGEFFVSGLLLDVGLESTFAYICFSQPSPELS